MNDLFIMKKDYGFLHFCNVYFDRTDSTIRLKFTRTYADPISKESEEFTVLNVTVNKEDITSRNDFKDVSDYGVFIRMVSVGDISKIMNNVIYAEEQKWSLNEVKKMMEGFTKYIAQAQIVYTYILNTTCATMTQKVSMSELHTVSSGIRLIYFTVPFTSGFNFKTTPIVLSIPATVKQLTIDEPFIEITEGDGILTTGMMNEFASTDKVIKPSLRMSFVDSDEKEITLMKDTNSDCIAPVNILVELINSATNELLFKEVEVHLESVNGYLPKNRIIIDPKTGTGKCKVVLDYLDAGDTVRVKCGFPYYTGVDELKINIA